MKGICNMSKVKEQGVYVLPDEGEYDIEITTTKDKQTSSGDDMVSIVLTITSGNFEGAYVWDNIVIPHLDSPAVKILGRTKHFLHCIGEPYDGEEVEWDSENWLYKKCRIKIDHEAPNEHHKNTRGIVESYILVEDDNKDKVGQELPF